MYTIPLLRGITNLNVIGGKARFRPSQNVAGALCASEMGHYRVFLRLARKTGPVKAVDARWQQMLAAEARILAEQPPGSRIHSGMKSRTE